ncbi:MAG: LpxL/LpxP family acyltransferase [Brevirhabdus sp.]
MAKRKSFTRFKDRVWFLFDGLLKSVMAAPAPLKRLGFGVIRAGFWLVYILPGSPARSVSRDAARHLGMRSGRAYFACYLNNFIIGLERMEWLRLGKAAALDPMLKIPDPSGLDAAMAAGKGAVMVMPHCHATVIMVRALARRYPVLMLIRPAQNQARRDVQRAYYDGLECELQDVRSTDDATVARAVIKALRAGKLVVGVTDRIRQAPPADAPWQKDKDNVRVCAFGQPVGVAGWPVRFAQKCGAPVIPAVVALRRDEMVLHTCAEQREPDMVAGAQGWMSALESGLRQHPCDWLFVFDKHWARVLSAPAPRVTEG